MAKEDFMDKEQAVRPKSTGSFHTSHTFTKAKAALRDSASDSRKLGSVRPLGGRQH